MYLLSNYSRKGLIANFERLIIKIKVLSFLEFLVAWDLNPQARLGESIVLVNMSYGEKLFFCIIVIMDYT